MSLRAPLLGDDPIPEETARIAVAAFPHGNVYTQLRDHFGMLYQNVDFVHLFAHDGQPALSPARLALVTVMQFMEGVGDRQAADFVRDRISWKYALGLSLDDPGFDFSVLSTFRSRLLTDDPTALLLDTVLTQFRDAGLVRVRGKQRTDSTHVLAAVRHLNRLEHLAATMRAALNQVADRAPTWLRQVVDPAWVDRYAQPADHLRLPKAEAARTALALTIGQDGYTLLTACWDASAPAALRADPLVTYLRQVWIQQFSCCDTPTGPEIRLRTPDEQPPTAAIHVSPYDPDARFGTKRDMHWTGYKIHVSETCDDETPNLITQVLTTPSTTPDSVVLAPIHRALAARDLLPGEHYLDAGYVDGPNIVTSAQEHQVTLVGPIIRDPSWQARTPGGVTHDQFVLDWDAQRATCPEGVTSVGWHPETDQGNNPVVVVTFPSAACRVCARRSRCTRANRKGRQLTLRPQEAHAAIQAGRAVQQTDTFRGQYQRRAGVEGSFTQANRRSDLRHARYVGRAKVHLQHVFTAIAVNLYRVLAWLVEVPRATTRISAFARLMQFPRAAASG